MLAQGSAKGKENARLRQTDGSLPLAQVTLLTVSTRSTCSKDQDQRAIPRESRGATRTHKGSRGRT